MAIGAEAVWGMVGFATVPMLAGIGAVRVAWQARWRPDDSPWEESVEIDLAGEADREATADCCGAIPSPGVAIVATLLTVLSPTTEGPLTTTLDRVARRIQFTRAGVRERLSGPGRRHSSRGSSRIASRALPVFISLRRFWLASTIAVFLARSRGVPQSGAAVDTTFPHTGVYRVGR